MQRNDQAIPLYVRVQEQLRRAIGREYRAGDLLPSQQELAAQTGTSLITVKRALDELARAGLVEAARGRGTIVKRPMVADNHAGISSFTDNLTGLGLEPRTAWTRIEERVPSREVKGVLGLKAREKTVYIERLRTVDGEPFALMENELPACLAPGLARSGLPAESIYDVLGRYYGICPERADEEVAARPATRAERELLGKEVKIVMEVRRTSYLADGSAMELAILRAPADRYSYRVQVSRRGK